MGLLGLADCAAACNAPVDADANTNLTHNLSMWGLSSIWDIYKLCIKSRSSMAMESIQIYDCNGTQVGFPVHQCDPMLDCNSNTVYVDWWWSGGDFYIEIRI